MARPSRPWFRFYVEAIYDRKLRGQPPATRWLWVTVLALARSSPISGYLMVSERTPASTADLMDLAAPKRGEVEAGMGYFEREGMVVHDSNLGALCVRAWADRQFESDNITRRTRKHRSKRAVGNVPSTFPGTPPETEADTETDT